MPAIEQKVEIDARAPAAAAFAIVAGDVLKTTLHSWREPRGLSAWLEKIFGSAFYVQFKAERQS